MFEGEFMESDAKDIYIKDVNTDAFVTLLYYMYTDQLKGCPGVDVDAVIVELIPVGAQFQVASISSLIEVYLPHAFPLLL